MKKTRLMRIVLSVLLCVPIFNATANEWLQIPVDSSIDIINDDGQPQTITPACAFDTITDPASGITLNNDFNFFFQPGDEDKLLVFFNGGGACWNNETCVGSLFLSNIPDNRPTYNPSMYQENTPVNAGGIFDNDDPQNPFASWSKVFIPYCTGDIHIGSNDYTYTDVNGAVTGFPGAPVTVQHRGFDNFMAVREWLKRYYYHNTTQPSKMLVAGSSAGGYGATINFPYLKSAFPFAKASLFSDAAAGILSTGFVDTTFTFDQPWLVEDTLPPMFSQFLGAYDAATLNQNMVSLLASTYPTSRFAQYSTAYDGVQVLFYKVSSEIDAGNRNPLTWALNETDFPLFVDWNEQMSSSYNYLDQILPNYQYFIGEGDAHTVLTNTYVVDPSDNPFYQERGDGVTFARWLERFANSWLFIKHSIDTQ